MSSEFLESEELRRSADPAGMPGPMTQAARKRPRSWRFALVGGLTAAALIGGTGVASAATSHGTPAKPGAATVSRILPRATSSAGPGMPGYGMGHRVLPVHGQIVVAKAGGGYQKVDFQLGSVMAVSTTSVTVRSSDGFTRTYSVTGSTIVAALRDGISSVKAGHQVVVVGTVSGGKATAAAIMDRTLVQASHLQFGFGAGAMGW
jgi:hypothetical protein